MTETINISKTCGFESPGWMLGRCLPWVWDDDINGRLKTRVEERLKIRLRGYLRCFGSKLGTGQDVHHENLKVAVIARSSTKEETHLTVDDDEAEPSQWT